MAVKTLFGKNGESHIGIYPSELKNPVFHVKNKGTYKLDAEIIKSFELVKWEHNGRLHEKYEVPFKYFEKIEDEVKVEKVEVKQETLSIEEPADENISAMTIRDFYCILHKIPKSNKKWLNKLILDE